MSLNILVAVRPCVVRIVKYEVMHWNTLQFQWQHETHSPPVHCTAWYKNRYK